MNSLDLSISIYEAWELFGYPNKISKITDISAKVSTNLVYRVDLERGSYIIAKASYFGEFKVFTKDHKTINILSNNLLYPYENFLGKSLMKHGEVFIHKTKIKKTDVWVVFYNPIRKDKQFPKILTKNQVIKFGEEMAKFHLACRDTLNHLPTNNKSLIDDIEVLEKKTKNKTNSKKDKTSNELIKKNCSKFFQNFEELKFNNLTPIPVLVDWNIGNFSVNNKNEFFSRWDYDWFRMAPRVMDFYFCSRVVSKRGDKTIFTYDLEPLKDKRFLMFIESYNEVFPLSSIDLLFIKEAYRFFILNYVIHHGKRFFRNFYSKKLINDALSDYLINLDESLDIEKTFKPLKLF